MFSEKDYTDFADNLRESVDEDLFATEDFVSDIDSFIAQTTNPFELVSEGKLKFSGDPTFRNVPKVAKDSFGREIIRLFNEMAGFRDGVEADLKYVDTRTGAPSKAKFRDKYERFGDSSMPGTGTGFSIDGLVLPNKFMSGSKNQKRSFELGHRLNTPHRFEGFAGIFGAPRKDVESYEEGKDVFSTIIKHMPFASALSGENDKQYSQDRVPLREGESRSRMLRESDQQVISTTPLSADRTYQKNSVTYDMGRSEEDQKLTRINNNEYEGDTRERLKTDIQSILSQNSVYDFQDARDILGDNVVSTTPGQGFYGKASQEGNQDVVRDAVEKALNLAVSDATYEAINEKALDVIKHRVASELVRRHKDVFEQLDLVGIMESSLNENYQDQDSINLITDSLGFVTGNATQVNYEDVTQKIKDALPERVMKDAEKILSQEIDDVADKIGFVPEDGNYKRYMSFIDRQRAVDPKLIAKFAKKLGIDNPDKLKKKLLIDSIINRNMIEPTGSTRFGTPGAGAATTRQNIEASMNPLQRFMGMADRANADFFVIQKKLEPIGYENIDHTAGYGYSLKPDPTLGNFFQLFTTQAYRGFMQGDRERAEALEKEANALVYKRGEAKKQRDENEVADTDEAEIDRRYDKMKEYIDKNAEKYNYSPEELKEALQRVREHNDTRAPKKYIRAPHNANETQTARGLLHSLIHQVTDPRFEQLYGRKIEGVVLPHRTDLYLTRAIEDSRVRDPRTFGMGTYGSAIQTLLERFEAAGATVDRDRIFEMKNVKNPNAPTASLNRPVQGVIDLSEGSIGRKIAEGKFTFRAKGGYIDLRRKAS